MIINEKIYNMGEAPIGTLLLKMSGPAMFSMIIQALYNIVDSIFVAQIGEDALTAVSIIYPIQMLMIAFAVGTGIGINSLISRKLGAGMNEDASKAANSGLKLGILNWIIFVLLGIFGSTGFVNMFSKHENIISWGIDYMRIVTICSLFAMLSILIEKILQSTGNMKDPMIIIVVGAVINIVLDPILIFGYFGFPALKVAGAAIATITAQFAAFVLAFYMFKKDMSSFQIKFFARKIDKNSVKDIYKVGLPAILMQAMWSLTMFGINGILAGFSKTAIAVMGIYNKLQIFAMMPVFGINQGALPLIGYNYGADNKKRLKKVYVLAVLFAVGVMFVSFIWVQCFSEEILYLFNGKKSMISIGVPALKTLSICFLPAGFGIISAAFFQGTNHGMIAFRGAVIRQLLGILVLALILGRIWGLSGIWWAFPLADIIGTAYYVLILDKNKKEFFID